jgi:hypothetical protein
MKITYRRAGGHMPPPDRELLTIQDDGSFTLWRSVNTPACGRFAGQLTLDQWNALQAEGAAAAQAGSMARPILPDSAIETIQVGDSVARLGHTDTPDGAWGNLVTHCRSLVTDLLDAPQAAVVLEVAPGAAGARLVHRGGRPISVDLSRLAVRAVLWGGYYEQRGNWQWAAPLAPGARGERGTGPGRVEAGPGWSLDLNFAHGFTPGADEVVHTYVTFSVFDQEGLVDVSLVDAPLLGQP